MTIQNVALTVTEFLTDGTTTTVTDTAQGDLSTVAMAISSSLQLLVM